MKAKDGKVSQSGITNGPIQDRGAWRACQIAYPRPKQPAEQEPRNRSVAANSTNIKQEQFAKPAIEILDESGSLNKKHVRDTLGKHSCSTLEYWTLTIRSYAVWELMDPA